MTEWADHAMVVRMGRFREADVWLKLLCRKRGLLTLFAFGASRSKRRFCGCLDVLNTLLCQVKAAKNGRFFNLQEAVLLTTPQALRKNWQRMALAANCLRFVEAFDISGDGAAEAFAIVENLRHTLENSLYLPSLFPLFFRLRLAGALGFAPRLTSCAVCGDNVTNRALFAVDEGQIRCTRCKFEHPTRYGVEISGGGLALLRHVQRVLPSAWLTEEPAATERRCCAKAIDGFVQYHLGVAWQNGCFRRV
ncbi:MAG: DNA repair/recombination protein RecO [Candidatus Desulfovibrio kirbyi]|uniref:DNA repair protein RecO n=1 Tax=Candidatus Desulfovibrio kirbyi TaxID=2696086 RepID=A0A6L2R6S8_9BACT|nr:MAG: DNA repair/recombination protein RecO [Candidatus Desulfovibrio kirbyi]